MFKITVELRRPETDAGIVFPEAIRRNEDVDRLKSPPLSQRFERVGIEGKI
jgi:hypothetical protein